jgi:hypothetical protein
MTYPLRPLAPGTPPAGIRGTPIYSAAGHLLITVYGADHPSRAARLARLLNSLPPAAFYEIFSSSLTNRKDVSL